MKKVLASATILSLMLVGCSNGGNDEASHKDDSSKTEQKDKSSSQHDSKKKIRNVMIQIISKTIRKITIIKRDKQVIKIQMMENNEQAKDQQQIQTEIHRIIKINNSNQYKITRINM